MLGARWVQKTSSDLAGCMAPTAPLGALHATARRRSRL